jgi:hypothetical protein
MKGGTFWDGVGWTLILATIAALILRRLELRVRFGVGQDIQLGSSFRYGQDITARPSR